MHTFALSSKTEKMQVSIRYMSKKYLGVVTQWSVFQDNTFMTQCTRLTNVVGRSGRGRGRSDQGGFQQAPVAGEDQPSAEAARGPVWSGLWPPTSLSSVTSQVKKLFLPSQLMSTKSNSLPAYLGRLFAKTIHDNGAGGQSFCARWTRASQCVHTSSLREWSSQSLFGHVDPFGGCAAW